MIFSHYTESFEILLDYLKIGEENIKEFAKKAIRNILHANIDVQNRRLFDVLPENEIKCIGKLRSRRANMTSAGKTRYDRAFQQVIQKGEESAMNYIKRFQNAQDLSVSVGNYY